ncbi:MAG: NifB/NifX family molybdenum-iron cluster-binding protein [Phycisphaerales bacterium]
MRICIPSRTNAGQKAKVHDHFGSAPYFTIYDTHTDICEIVDNSNRHHAHGTCHPLNVLDGKGINAVVCAGMGARAIQKLNESGIRAYRASGTAVQEIIDEYRASNLEEITQENACGHHGCH